VPAWLPDRLPPLALQPPRASCSWDTCSACRCHTYQQTPLLDQSSSSSSCGCGRALLGQVWLAACQCAQVSDTSWMHTQRTSNMHKQCTTAQVFLTNDLHLVAFQHCAMLACQLAYSGGKSRSVGIGTARGHCAGTSLNLGTAAHFIML
jgi:hypothetical protein